MRLAEAWRVAVDALRANRLRSVLTMLGVIIGVAAVIAMMAIGEGAKKLIEEQFAAMGTNLLIIQSGSSSSGGVRGGFGSQPTLTWDDLAAIRTEVSSVKAAAPQASLIGLSDSIGDSRPAISEFDISPMKACIEEAEPRRFGYRSRIASVRIGNTSAMPTQERPVPNARAASGETIARGNGRSRVRSIRMRQPLSDVSELEPHSRTPSGSSTGLFLIGPSTPSGRRRRQAMWKKWAGVCSTGCSRWPKDWPRKSPIGKRG